MIKSVEWTDGNYLNVGESSNDVQTWDVEQTTYLRKKRGYLGCVKVLARNNSELFRARTFTH